MTTIRKFEPPGAEAVSNLIRQTMKISNSPDYPAEILQPLIDYFSPPKIAELNLDRDCLIAETDNRIVGTIALEDAELFSFFVRPDYQGKGVGKLLLKEIERLAAERGVRQISVGSSITAVSFYLKMDYRETGDSIDGAGGKLLVMEKKL